MVLRYKKAKCGALAQRVMIIPLSDCTSRHTVRSQNVDYPKYDAAIEIRVFYTCKSSYRSWYLNTGGDP